MARLSPRNAVAHGYLADALFTTGDNLAGKQELIKAVQLDPSYVYGASKLLELQIGGNEMDAAAQTVDSIRKHIGDWQCDEAEVKFASAKRHDKKKALAALRRLCGVPENHLHNLNNAIQTIYNPGWQKYADKI